PPRNQDYVRVIPLGGLDEVGMNCCIVEANGSMVMIDCGLTFPESSGFGIDIILPDLAYVLDNLDILDAVILTHGHEDHIGALPFFLKEVDVPVYGGKLTLGMLGRKLGEHNLSKDDVTFYPVDAGDRLKIGEFVVEFIHTNHSVPNAMSIALETGLGRLIFTGDWKLDHTPLNEPPMDLQRFAQLGLDGTLALMADSTNSGTPGFSKSELEIKEGFANVFDATEGRLIVAQFSSNLHRVQGLMELAVEFGRKITLMGRSMTTNFELARSLGFIDIPKGAQLIDPHDIDNHPDDELLIISTGSQGEPRAGLTRMAYGAHRVTLRPTDTIVLSARIIPGNEVAIHNMLNNLTKTGAKVITQRDANIHATGHAKREEMKLMLNLVKPEHLVPVHGSYRMRKQHADIGETLGIKSNILIEDGDVLEFREDGVAVIDRVHAGRVFVDGRASGGDIESMQLRDRKKLAHSGIIVAYAILDKNTGDLSSGPDLLQRGFLKPEDDGMLDAASDYATQALSNLSAKERHNVNEVSETIRASIRRFFRKKLDRKPVVIPIVHEM
ncbi:unnamed protein product, partial [Laminaria digitata]